VFGDVASPPKHLLKVALLYLPTKHALARRNTKSNKLLPFSVHSINRSLIVDYTRVMADYTGGSADAEHLCVLVHGVSPAIGCNCVTAHANQCAGTVMG
jgi:hypothetical protein